jgi:hypothetical protein
MLRFGYTITPNCWRMQGAGVLLDFVQRKPSVLLHAQELRPAKRAVLSPGGAAV